MNEPNGFKVTVMEFYPVERNDSKQSFKGGLHVIISLAGFEINIRGIQVSRNKEIWYFSMPHRIGIHHVTKLSVKYPIVNFTDEEMNKALRDEIRSKGTVFIEEWLKTHTEAPGSIIAELPQQSACNKQKRCEEVKNGPEKQFDASNPVLISSNLKKLEDSISRPSSTIKTKVFVDLPPLKARNQPRKMSNGR